MPANKDKQRNTWYVKFYYTDWTGSRKQKLKRGFNTKREAQEFERSFLATEHADCTMLFKDLYALYMNDCKSRLKPTTIENKINLITHHLLPYFGNKRLDKINSSMVRRWQNEIIDKGFKPSYQKSIHNQASAMFNFAVKYYKLSENPARICGSIGSKKTDTMKIWTPEQYKSFIYYFAENLEMKTAYELLFWTGIRSGELLALTVADININAKQVTINKTYARLNGEDLIQTPKTPKSNRVIDIPFFLCQLLFQYISQLYKPNPTDRLFLMTKHKLSHQMKRACKATGVEKIRIHDLRHSHASMLIEQGLSPLLVSERLGHEKVQTTLETYSHLYPNKHKEAADKLQELYNNL